ncbi:MAG: hypothetical protein H0W46_08755, partial [Acidimicrobiia bacterium]|nr:hypothetical protein [Acidimicrobiia bacterium]
DELPAGQLGLLLTNDGEEAHEIAVLRKNEGVTATWDELLELPEEEAREMVTEVGGAFAPTNGAVGLLVGELEAGEHIALCFIPVGTSMGDDGEFIEGDGPPHFVEGMRHEFTVN